VDHSQFDTRLESYDSEWIAHVERATSADVRQMLRTERRRRRERWIVGTIATVAACLVLVLLGQMGLFHGDGPVAAPDPAPDAAPVRLDHDRPFAGTPAADWADGVGGIRPPAPAATGDFTADQVATALAQVRDLLVTSRLDRTLVVAHDAGRFLAAFAPDARRLLEPLFGSGQEARAQALVSLVAADAQLLPVEPKVNGRMWVSASGPGELVVHTNYVFVYPFRTDGPDAVVDPMDTLVAVPTALFVTVYALCTAAAVRLTTGGTRVLAGLACAVVLVILVFSGWALLAVVAVAVPAAVVGRAGGRHRVPTAPTCAPLSSARRAVPSGR